jgi:hypothetical protein
MVLINIFLKILQVLYHYDLNAFGISLELYSDLAQLQAVRL